MSQQAQAIHTPPPSAAASVMAGTLRAEMEARRAGGRGFSVKESLGLIVPLCTHLASLHAQGKAFYLHPSSIQYNAGGDVWLRHDLGGVVPTNPRDRACLSPEERKGDPGDARASVFSVGAILYELLTNSSVGPGMRRPAEVVRDLPPDLEAILGKALVVDPKHRPGDLAALAQALHHIAPNASVAPPPADPSHLDHEGDFEVDVRLSMIPPNEAPPTPAIPKAAALPNLAGVQVQGDGPYAVAVRRDAPVRRSVSDPTQRLADLKSALESDPRPRYVVVKEGMDHGPFSAVELLQQIASGSFLGDYTLRDVFSREERFIKDWEEFAPFAEQAKLNRDIVQEKKDFAAVVVAEKQGARYKALLGGAVLLLMMAGAAGFWARNRTSKEHEAEIQAQEASAVDINAGLGAGSKKSAAGGVARSAGGVPILSGGMSCEAAQKRYVEDYDKSSPPDLTAGAFGSVLNNGSYLNACGVPSSTKVNVCAAIQNGRAVGVTVTLNPSDAKLAGCVAGAVRGMSFPSHPRLDVTRTSF
jgi:eukaryotic-like serine/threonine-protein kinase